MAAPVTEAFQVNESGSGWRGRCSGRLKRLVVAVAAGCHELMKLKVAALSLYYFYYSLPIDLLLV
ncbi:hypothetical protein SLEP1_g53602 [Rubroshorea leprosula]|uniref:Uncharacterized protein n=1 Tax=Rubroshorea leprosula TaxID=152421 RepID=A0AAV5MDE9_9ROSI|nr:hypothetical protein SLEP1_g53602 [Rubroshorea leprosula]